MTTGSRQSGIIELKRMWRLNLLIEWFATSVASDLAAPHMRDQQGGIVPPDGSDATGSPITYTIRIQCKSYDLLTVADLTVTLSKN